VLSVTSHALPPSSRLPTHTLNRANSSTSAKRSRSHQHDGPYPPSAAHPSLHADPRVLGPGSEWNAGAHYAPPPRGVTQELLDEVEAVDGEEEDHGLYCICQKQSYGEMVGCDDDGCDYQWVRLCDFHFSSGGADLAYSSTCRAWA
jgi:hypothetical protein